MSEKLFWTPDDPEKEPYAELSFPDGLEFVATRENATLYTHLGRLAIYDHVHLCEVEDGEVAFSARIWNFASGYPQLAMYMIENQYPALINQTVVLGADARAYDLSIKNLAGNIDEIPKDWRL